METENVRLKNFKISKGRRLDELEQKVTKYQLFEKVNVEKLISVLQKQHNELNALKSEKTNFGFQLEVNKKKNREELQEVHRRFKAESKLKSTAFEQLEKL